MDKVDWRSLAATLTIMTEKEVEWLLNFEMDNQRRPSIVRRLHQRFSILRSARERAELMERLAA